MVDGVAAAGHQLEPKAQVTSRDEILPQGLGHGMGAIAHAKFDLDLLQVAADRLFTDLECLRHFAVSGPRGDQTQDGDFARRQPSRPLRTREIRAGQLLQT